MRYKDLNENYSPEKDDSVSVVMSDTRITRLTLKHLSELRNIREYRKYENTKRAEKLKSMYSSGGSEDGGDLEL